MKNDDLISSVELYFDGELSKDKEPVLFSLLSQNEDARLYFKELHFLRSAVLETEEQLPFDVEEKIMCSIVSKESKPIKLIFAGWLPSIAYAAALIMIVLSAVLFWQISNYQTEVKIISEKLTQQNRTMELILYNSFPTTEVEPKNQNEIIIKASL